MKPCKGLVGSLETRSILLAFAHKTWPSNDCIMGIFTPLPGNAVQASRSDEFTPPQRLIQNELQKMQNTYLSAAFPVKGAKDPHLEKMVRKLVEKAEN